MNIFEGAVEDSVIVMQLNATNDPFVLALSFDENGDHEKAERFYREAIEKNDRAADAYCNLGIIKLEEGLTIEAIDCFTNALTKEPRLLEAHFNLANLYFDIGDLPLAISHYKVAVEINPDLEDAYYNLALAEVSQKDFISAIGHLEKYQAFLDDREAQKVNQLIVQIRKSTNL